jgi:hypothetical protein
MLYVNFMRYYGARQSHPPCNVGGVPAAAAAVVKMQIGKSGSKSIEGGGKSIDRLI